VISTDPGRAAKTTESSMARHAPLIDRLTASAYSFPTDRPESDGTFEWESTTIVIVELVADGTTGLGYTYASEVAAPLIVNSLARDVLGADAFDVSATARAMSARLRNAGRPGIGATAISAVDNALWDLKARLLGVSLVDLLGAVRESIRGYGSGGFCSYTDDELRNQVAGWADERFSMVKMKIGRDPGRDPERVAAARSAIGQDVELFVDANGAFAARDAVAAAHDWLAREQVTWFEEPVSSDNVLGLRFVREHVPSYMAVAAGEYGWTPFDFERLADGPSVDVMQADATRCLGITGFLRAAAMCDARRIPLSAHCAPSLHAHLACAALAVRHIEWFHDHVRLEHAFFDGAAVARNGRITVDRSRPGLGLDVKRGDVEPYLVWRAERTQ
jgi:L-alanine-DL-glutamate epimerase-like enolase superfamily enzyme